MRGAGRAGGAGAGAGLEFREVREEHVQFAGVLDAGRAFHAAVDVDDRRLRILHGGADVLGPQAAGEDPLVAGIRFAQGLEMRPVARAARAAVGAFLVGVEQEGLRDGQGFLRERQARRQTRGQPCLLYTSRCV